MPYSDPQKQKEAQHRSYLRNREKINARGREWKKNNPEKVKQGRREYSQRIEAHLIDEYNLETILIQNRMRNRAKMRYGKYWESFILAMKIQRECAQITGLDAIEKNKWAPAIKPGKLSARELKWRQRIEKRKAKTSATPPPQT